MTLLIWGCGGNSESGKYLLLTDSALEIGAGFGTWDLGLKYLLYGIWNMETPLARF